MLLGLHLLPGGGKRGGLGLERRGDRLEAGTDEARVRA
jgi:hypothetical protein